MRPKLDPVTRRLQRPARQKSAYKIIAVGIYDDLAEALDRAAEGLRLVGFKANRSFVVQALVRHLQHEMEGLPPEAILSFFIEKYMRRPLAPASSREVSKPEGAASPARIEPRQRMLPRARRQVGRAAGR